MADSGLGAEAEQAATRATAWDGHRDLGKEFGRLLPQRVSELGPEHLGERFHRQKEVLTALVAAYNGNLSPSMLISGLHETLS